MDPRESLRVDGGNSVAPPSDAEDSLPTPAEELSAKRELRKILREDSNWSIRTISITALTGVSVALIATQLNGLVSSFVLIAVMAFITASVSEIYRVFLALTGFGAKRAAAKAAKVLPLVPAEQRAALREEVREEISTAPRREEENPITGALHVVTDAYRLNLQQEASGPNGFQRFLYRLKNYGRANPFLWLVVLFLGIALATVSVAYLATDGEPPRIIQRTVVQTEELPAEDRAAIVTEAKDQALDELETQAPEPSATPVMDPAMLEELTAMGDRLSAMEAEITALQAAEAVPTPSIDPTTQSLVDRVSDLEAERTALSERVAELEAAAAAAQRGSGSTAPTSSGATAVPTVR